MIDYIEKKIDSYLRKGKYNFWTIKKKLAKEGLCLDKPSLLTRIKNIMKWKN